MTRLLASVTDLEEAATAIRSGADIIDLKDPSRGALGALPPKVVRAIVKHIAGCLPVSATIGDLPADPMLLAKAIRETAATGVDYVKVGFFTNEKLVACLQGIAELTPHHAIIAVLFADRSPPLQDLVLFASAGFTGVMLDTADKKAGRLLDHASLCRLERFVARARSLSLLTGLAGSLRLEDVPMLLPLSPDYLGFRGALCRKTDRMQRVDADRLAAIRRAVGPHSVRAA
ncbi:MAG: (5-formylfuran-3-yl)methyl phosphate synthase [Chromatiaceae bacterium]